MEEADSTNSYSPEESRCEAIFSKTVQRRSDGRYSVALPKNENAISRLGESKEIAFRRFLSTERRLIKDTNLQKQYIRFMEEYLQLGHMRKVEEDPEATKRCFLPHHPVVKEASTTTKVRVVFDASCKTASGLALNEVLLVGPVIQQSLRSIILRSCMKQILLVADVEKMFRQILVHPEDRPFQSIIWRPSSLEEVCVYELNSVTYGTNPPPFLATRTLTQLAKDEGERYPLAAQAITEDTYMDDVITGCDNLEDAKKIQQQLDEMTRSGGFQLRKWASNCAEVLKSIPDDNRAIRLAEGINLDPDPSVKALGLTWLPGKDVFRFQFDVPPVESVETLTKRKILSIIATLFDPLGFIGATTTAAKVFMQLLWTTLDERGQRLDWDQPLPPTVGESWRKFHVQLPILNEIRIERCVIIPNVVDVQIHYFSDASQKAYSACLYIHSQTVDGNVKVQLLSSNYKVSPLKPHTIPRIELSGALIAAQLFEKVRQATNLQVRTTFWVDSSCALRWIQASPSTWFTFVAKRVAKIQALTKGCVWRHVAGVENPADLVSRGIGPKDIVNNGFWWHGPSWLAKERSNWPNSNPDLKEEGEEERRRTAVVVTASAVADFNEGFISTTNSYTTLIRRVAIWQRLIRSLQTPEDRPNGFLRADELRQAECTLIRKVQEEVFPDELLAVRKKESVGRRSPLRWYHPHVCENGILRVGGRLCHSDEHFDTKHPMVLPARHRLTRLIFEHYHLRLLHAGPQLLLATVRQRYWPLGGRNVARQVVHKCVTCFRSKPRQVQQFMGELPSSRVTVSRPFSKSGVDYFGPVYLRPVPRRAAVKAYVAIFVCMCTKAVHMELVSDLSTERFLQALRRFTARRGKATDLYSDNGTNFVGARNQLKELFRLWKHPDHRRFVTTFCASEGISWHFNPPGSPHFGGLWEAAVRSAKYHILRVIGSNPVSHEEMLTLLVQVEACLNSRPLTTMSDDPDDLEPLTPAHFLVGSSLHSIPEPDLRPLPTNRLRQYQLTQQQLQHFWDRWKREYLCQLQGRAKRWSPPVQFEVGQLVVIHDKNQPPMRWRMGRIKQVHPGADGVVRVVTLKTSSGELRRAVETLCLLPTSETATSET
ncbi:uncharacterized protein LOC134210011 [Armigeres subalbatus]|uniref:uncharacterized protein LOC134210011 n=1 Tax=Armigeres subalbatus TaxID=124917 RepID=UPI002ED1471D